MAERSRIIKKSSPPNSPSNMHAKPSQSNTVPTHSQGFLLPGNRTGPASAAMAWRLWKVEPIRSQSFVPIFGAFGPNERWWMRPPDLLTMKRWSGAILLAHLAALLLAGLAGVESEQVVSPRSGPRRRRLNIWVNAWSGARVHVYNLYFFTA